MNKRVFDDPFIGYDYGNDHGWNFDAPIGQYGNPIIGIKIKNPVEQFSADPEGYLSFHKLLNQVVSIIGEGYIVQKLDIFSKQVYEAETSTVYLQQKYSDHFNGRQFRRIDSLLVFTERIEKKYKFSEKKFKDLRDKVQKVYLILSSHNCSPKFLYENDWEYYIGGVLSMHFDKTPIRDNILTGPEYLKFGNRFVKTLSFVDAQRIELPNEIEPYSYLGGNGSAADTAVDNFSFINELEHCQTIIYNQVISLPNQAKTQRDMEKKKRRLLGAASNNPRNGINALEIEELQADIAINGQLVVDAHFSICYSAHDLDSFEKTESEISSKLFVKNIIISKDSENQLELFRSHIPGNAVELKDYDYFTTTSEASLCFFFKESFPVDEESNIYLRFTDRQGVPLKVDLSDLPMKDGRINNRNKFVLGPSGSGKSFAMNNIVEQYLNFNYDVVIVDTGDSYSGTCAYKGGKYIKYTEEKPITMNPFLISEEEFNIEKMEFLSNLIFLIWQGADASPSPTQKSIIDNAILAYYHQFFNREKDWYKDKSSENLLLYLNKFNIYEDDIRNKLNEKIRKSETYYDILGIGVDAQPEEIKEKGRELIKTYHPDRNKNIQNYDPSIFYKIYEAYDTLTDIHRRKAYNETHLILQTSKDIIKPDEFNVDNYDKEFREAVIDYIQLYQKELNVTSLSFNSFYDFCKDFLPIYLNNKSHKIKETEFNIRTFLYVLKDFYKGGRYETTLNENADNSLFEESFIVFEIDNVKDNPKLFPIVTLIIMDTFIQKMRLRSDRRKCLVIEEAWKAIASKLMGGYIKYLYKTVRKFWGETIVVTQELTDIIGNEVVKDAIISNSDSFILLDQTKFKDNFDDIAALLSLNKVERNKIFTINNINNKFGRSYFKEFYLKRGTHGQVFGNEVSLHQYLTYTTEKPEKNAISYYLTGDHDYNRALEKFVNDLQYVDNNLKYLVSLVNLYKMPLDQDLINFFRIIKETNPRQNTISLIEKMLDREEINLKELVSEYKLKNVG